MTSGPGQRGRLPATSTIASQPLPKTATHSTQGAGCPSTFLPVVHADEGSFSLRVYVGDANETTRAHGPEYDGIAHGELPVRGAVVVITLCGNYCRVITNSDKLLVAPSSFPIDRQSATAATSWPPTLRGAEARHCGLALLSTHCRLTNVSCTVAQQFAPRTYRICVAAQSLCAFGQCRFVWRFRLMLSFSVAAPLRHEPRRIRRVAR